MSAERYRGRAWARALHSSEIGMWQDAMVLGEWDWRDWFSDKPSRDFLRGAADEIEHRDQNDGYYSVGC